MADFTRVRFPHAGEAAVDEIYAYDPTVCLVLTRSNNGNVMVYRRDPARPAELEFFWLDLEPSYRHGRAHDRQAPNLLERRAYGVKVLDATPSRLRFAFQKFPAREFVVHRLPDGRATTHVRIGDAWCQAHHIHVHVGRRFGLPYVTGATVAGTSLREGRRLTEDVPR